MSEKLGRCGRQNMLWPYQKIWDWDLIFGRAVKAISSPGVRSPCLTAMDSCDTERLIVHQDGSTATAATASITASGGGSGGGAASATASTTSTRQQPSLLRLRRNTVYNNYHVIFLIRMYCIYLLIGCSPDLTTNSKLRFYEF